MGDSMGDSADHAGREDERGRDQRGRGERPAPLGAGALGKQPPTRQRETQVRFDMRLPRWRGRHHGRHELDHDQAAAAAVAWAHELAREAGQVSLNLADELAARRVDRAALAIEREYLETAELDPANSDQLPPGWAVWDPPAGEAADPEGWLDPGGPEPERDSGDWAEDAAEFAADLDEGGLGAGRGPAIMLAARILDEAATVEGALELAAGALEVLGEIDEATRVSLDEDTRRLAGLLDGGELVELDELRGDA